MTPGTSNWTKEPTQDLLPSPVEALAATTWEHLGRRGDSSGASSYLMTVNIKNHGTTQWYQKKKVQWEVKNSPVLFITITALTLRQDDKSRLLPREYSQGTADISRPRFSTERNFFPLNMCNFVHIVLFHTLCVILHTHCVILHTLCNFKLTV